VQRLHFAPGSDTPGPDAYVPPGTDLKQAAAAGKSRGGWMAKGGLIARHELALPYCHLYNAS
jgi:hypothetical protein